MLGVYQTWQVAATLFCSPLCVCYKVLLRFHESEVFVWVIAYGWLSASENICSEYSNNQKTNSVKIHPEQYRDDINIVWCFALKWNNVASTDTVLECFRDQQSQLFGEYNNFQIREHVIYCYNFNLGWMSAKRMNGKEDGIKIAICIPCNLREIIMLSG